MMPSSQRRPGARHAHRIAVQLSSTQILPFVAVNKDAFSARQPTPPAVSNQSARQNKHRFLA
jgi:hypothetical protein